MVALWSKWLPLAVYWYNTKFRTSANMTPYVSHVSQLKLRVRDFLGRATAKVLVKWSNEDISEATWEFFFDWSRSFLISTIRSWLFRRGRFDIERG